MNYHWYKNIQKLYWKKPEMALNQNLLSSLFYLLAKWYYSMNY